MDHHWKGGQKVLKDRCGRLQGNCFLDTTSYSTYEPPTVAAMCTKPV